ncbi:FeS assembly SUF system protein [Parvularcula dongshanensis]|uniref:FeS assembly SUF system protein n=2 Tax=Parvularcula dongshanensis TaxID=1173995 RepID=A0A840I6B4_9PROT|nr:SUF system Fe-S cluster assembly protein [Parvularcula dongshanensis]MBB4659550.1 FeS assembly SUF system protein [Parvularcula dongshanensis]
MSERITAPDFAGEDFDPLSGGRDMDEADLSALSPPREKRDVIDLGGPSSAGKLLSESEMSEVTGRIVDALKTVYDPEIPVDIYELGLIYQVDFEPPTDETGGEVKILMTLTAPGCPVAGEMPGWVETAVKRVDGVDRVDVDMTFDPPWSPERMSDEAKLELGWM